MCYHVGCSCRRSLALHAATTPISSLGAIAQRSPMQTRLVPVLLLSVAAALHLTQPVYSQTGSARYQLTFHGTWSSSTHPNQFPSGPHFSNLVGSNHNSAHVFWQPGSLASIAIKDIAERGAQPNLFLEVSQQILAGNAEQYFNVGALSTSPGQFTNTFTVQANFSKLTLVSMLGPSPDWFVGINGFDLVQNGDWVESVVIPLHLYDAGTDSGVNYASANSSTVPPNPIALVTTASGSFQGASTIVASITLQRLSSSLAFGCSNSSGSLSTSGMAQLGHTLQVALADPTGQMPTPAVSALAFSASSASNFPCGTSLPGFGLAVGAAGEVLLGSLDGLVVGPLFAGGSSTFSMTLPNQPALVGQQFYFQGLFASTRLGVTQGLAIRIGS